MTEETWSRPSGRKADELRPIKITRHYTKYAEGSVLIEVGGTKVCSTFISQSNLLLILMIGLVSKTF